MHPCCCLKLIREYTDKHPELKNSHHFLFDLPLVKEGNVPEFIVIGMNPGEPSGNEVSTTISEESRECDFHVQAGRVWSELPWSKLVHYFCDTWNVVQSEFFFGAQIILEAHSKNVLAQN